MSLSRSGRRALAGACALVLLVAACGEDDDSADTTDDTEQTTESTEAADETTESTAAEDETTASEPEDETTTSEAEEGDPEAVAVAEAINITLGDLAEGWVEEESDEPEEEDEFNQCFTTVDIEATTVGEAETPGFSVETPDGQGGQAISMQTIVFDSPETATSVLAEVATPEFAACTQETFTSEAVEGTTAALTPVVDDPPVAEESVGLAGVVEIPAEDGSTQQGSVDLHAIRTGAVASFTFTLDIGETPDTAFQQTLAELYSLIADRQAAEAG